LRRPLPIACRIHSLLNEEGSLLASTGAGDHVVVAAIASNVWAQYQKLGNQDLEYMLFDCEVRSPNLSPPPLQANSRLSLSFGEQQGRVVMTKVSTHLLCLYSDKSAEFGMLKRKVRFVAGGLAEGKRPFRLGCN
jgi:hypothetical protein